MNESEAVRLVGTSSELNALPFKLRRAIEDDGLKRLQSIRFKISDEAAFPMPPITVVPWGLVAPRNRGVVWGYVSFADCGSVQKVGAFLPAATLLFVRNDELLRRIIVHEFAHSFWAEVQFLRSAFDGAEEIGQVSTGSQDQQWATQMVEDKNQLVEPTGWFGNWDVEHFLNDYEEPLLAAAGRSFHREWISANLPVKVHKLTPHVSGKGEISDEVVERARELNLVKNLPPQ